MDVMIAAVGAILLIAIAFALAPRRELKTEIMIDAPPAIVWAVISNPAGYRDWNPFLVSMEGELVEGATLTNRMKPSKGSEMTFRPTVLKVVPERELRWLGRLLLPRLFDGEHYFLLHPQDGGTRLVHGENFHGIGLWFMQVEKFRADFDGMNAVLKEKAENEVKLAQSEQSSSNSERSVL